jgi:uncharacterized membrane protein
LKGEIKVKNLDKFIVGVLVAFSGLLIGNMVYHGVPYQIRLLLVFIMGTSIWGKIVFHNHPILRFLMNATYLVVVVLSIIAVAIHRRDEVGQTEKTDTKLTTIQEQFISQSTMTVRPMDGVGIVVSVDSEITSGVYEVGVAYSIKGAENLLFGSAVYIGQKPKKNEEVDLIRIEQSGSDPYEKRNGQRSSFILVSPRVVKVDLKNDPYPGMQREEVEK